MARADPTPTGFGRSVAGSQPVGKCGRNLLRERCERATNVEAGIEACSSVIQTDNDHHRLAMAYFNRAGWYLKKDDVNRAASDLSEAIGLEPDFAAALTKRGLLEERRNDLRSARADFAAVLKLPTTNSLSAWAHAMARERLAATEAAAAKSAAASNSRPESFGSGYLRFLEGTARTGSSRMQREAIRSDQSYRRKRCNRAQSMFIEGASICPAWSLHY